MQQSITPEVMEFKLQEIVQNKTNVMVRVILFGGVELCHFGTLQMNFDQDTACPFFAVQHHTQYATTVRFYGSDVVQLKLANGELPVAQICLGVNKPQE